MYVGECRREKGANLLFPLAIEPLVARQHHKHLVHPAAASLDVCLFLPRDKRVRMNATIVVARVADAIIHELHDTVSSTAASSDRHIHNAMRAIIRESGATRCRYYHIYLWYVFVLCTQCTAVQQYGRMLLL